MKDHYDAIRAAGGEVLAVSFTRPERVAAYLERYPLPFPAVSDPERAAYRAFALGRTGWGAFFRPSVLLGYFRLMFRGWLPKQPGEGEDVLQLGGDFVIDRQGRLVYAYPSEGPTDRPRVEEVVAAMRRAAGT